MYSIIELKSFDLIDQFLKFLVDKGSGSFYDIDRKNTHSTECQFSYKLMCDDQLISFRKGYSDKKSIVDITREGLAILKLGGYQKFLEAKKMQSDNLEYAKNLEIEKTKTDLELAKRMLKEYPLTKWAARLGFVISLGLAIFEVIKYFKGK